MSSIFEPINGEITKQIDLRQKVMSNEIKNPKVRNTFLNKRCTVRLVPLVQDINTKIRTNIGRNDIPTEIFINEVDPNNFIFNNYTIDRLLNISSAKAYVYTPTLPEGYELRNEILSQLQETGDSLYRPIDGFHNTKEKPFIKDFNIITRSGNNYGATRIGDITIIIPTQDQFNLLERYFRIGVPFLLEWGWSTYISDINSIERLNFINSELYSRNKSILNQFELEQAIINNKQKNNGNYDGGIFIVKNFTTNIQNSATDYYFELKLDLITKGDILNSLKPSKGISNSNQTSDYAIIHKINNNSLVRSLRFLNQYESGYKEQLKEKETSLNITVGENILGKETPPTEIIETDRILKILSETTNIQESIDEIGKNFLPIRNISKSNIVINLGNSFGEGGSSYSQYQEKTVTSIKEISYVKLSYFLQMLNRSQAKSEPGYVDEGYTYSNPQYYYTLTGNNISNSLKFQWDENKHFGSFNPSKIILPSYPLAINNLKNNNFIENKDRFKISNILIRTSIILDEIIELIKQDQFTISNILKILLDLINEHTDNELRLIKYDLEDGRYTIISLTNPGIINSDIFSLKLYNTGSIVESTTIDTTLNDSIAKEVAIMFNGSNDYSTSAESISLLKFNRGIRSRFSKNLIEDSENSPDPEPASLYLNFIENSLNSSHSDIFNANEDPNFDTIFSDILSYFQKFKEKYHLGLSLYGTYDNIRGVPLFPIKIKTTLPGISGIKIGNKLKIEDSRLPLIYTDRKIYYVITNIENKIIDRYWNTLLDLSPQVDTQIQQVPIGDETNDINQPINANDVSFDFNTFLKALQQVETGTYEFEPISPGSIERWRSRRGNEWNNSPLFSQASSADYVVRARGPYQIKPAYVFDAFNGIAQFSNIQKRNGRYEWKVINNLVAIDSFSYQEQAVRNYINRYFTNVSLNKRTYKRASAIHHLGPLARLDYSDIKNKINEGLNNTSDNEKWRNIRNNFINFETDYWPNIKTALEIDPNLLVDIGQPNNFNF